MLCIQVVRDFIDARMDDIRAALEETGMLTLTYNPYWLSDYWLGKSWC